MRFVDNVKRDFSYFSKLVNFGIHNRPSERLRRDGMRNIVNTQFQRGIDIGTKRAMAYHPGAEGGVLRSDWTTVPKSATSIIRDDFKSVCARAEYAYRSDGLTRRVVNLLANFIVGQGIQPFPAVKMSNGEYAEGVNKRLADDWERFNDQGMRCGNLHMTMYQGQFIKCITMIVYGSVLQNVIKSRKGSMLPWAFQILKPLRLDFSKDNYFDTSWETDTKNKIVHGMKLNEYQEAEKFYFENEDFARDAENIDLSFMPIEAEQYLGISWLTPALPAIYDRQQILSDQLKISRIAAKLGIQMPRNLQQGVQSVLETDEGSGQNYIDLDFQGFFFSDGDVKPINLINPISESLEVFMRMILQEVAISVGVSYQRLTTDLKDANFTSGRINTLLDTKIFRCLFKSFTDVSTQLDWNRFVEWEAFTGRLEKHGVGYSQYLSDPWYYAQCYLLPRDGEDWVDPLKDAQARLLLRKMGKLTFQEDCALSGANYKSKLKQLAQEKKDFEEYDLKEYLPQNIDKKEQVEKEEKETKNADTEE